MLCQQTWSSCKTNRIYQIRFRMSDSLRNSPLNYSLLICFPISILSLYIQEKSLVTDGAQFQSFVTTHFWFPEIAFLRGQISIFMKTSWRTPERVGNLCLAAMTSVQSRFLRRSPPPTSLMWSFSLFPSAICTTPYLRKDPKWIKFLPAEARSPLLKRIKIMINVKLCSMTCTGYNLTIRLHFLF